MRVEASILTARLYALLGPRHTLEEFLNALANVAARVRVRTPPHAVSGARTLTDAEARLDFAFALYDLDGDGVVSRAEIAEIVDGTLRGNAKKVASVLRAALGEPGDEHYAASLSFAEFKRAAERAPGFLYPAFSAFEILREHAAHAAATLARLKDADEARRTSVATATGRPDRATESSTAASTGGGGARPPKEPPGREEALELFRALSERQLRDYLAGMGMDLGLDLMSKAELVDLAAAGALSSGALPDPSAIARPRDRAVRSPRRGGGAAPGADAGGGDRRQPRTNASLSPVEEAHRAARMGRADELEAIIVSGGISVDARDRSGAGFTPLMRAAVDGHKSACKRLLGMGADARATDAEGRTALDLALAYKHAALADYLRVRGGVPLGEEIERAGRGDGRAETRSTRRDFLDDAGSGRGGGGAADEATATRAATEEFLARRERDARAASSLVGIDGDSDDASEPPPADEGPLLRPE